MANDTRTPDWPALARTLGMTVPEMMEHASARATLARLDAADQETRERLGPEGYAAYAAWLAEVFDALEAGGGSDASE